MTQVRFGAGAVKSRSSRSPARLPSLAGIVVRMPLERRIPCSPRALIARSTVPGEASRQRPAHERGHLPPAVEAFWGQPAHGPARSTVQARSRTASMTSASLMVRAATGRWVAPRAGRSARRPGSPAHAGPGRSTRPREPSARSSSMNATISGCGGRAPPRRKSRPGAGSRCPPPAGGPWPSAP